MWSRRSLSRPNPLAFPVETRILDLGRPFPTPNANRSKICWNTSLGNKPPLLSPNLLLKITNPLTSLRQRQFLLESLHLPFHRNPCQIGQILPACLPQRLKPSVHKFVRQNHLLASKARQHLNKVVVEETKIVLPFRAEGLGEKARQHRQNSPRPSQAQGKRYKHYIFLPCSRYSNSIFA